MRIRTAVVCSVNAVLMLACGAAPKTESVHKPVNEEPLVLQGVSTDSAEVPETTSTPKKSAFANDNEMTTDDATGVPGMPGSDGLSPTEPSSSRWARAKNVSRATFSVPLDAPQKTVGAYAGQSVSWTGSWQGVDWVAPDPKKHPKIAGVAADTVAYGFKNGSLAIIQSRFRGNAACKKVQHQLETHNHLEAPAPGAMPPMPPVPDHPDFEWDDGRTYLEFRGFYDSPKHAKDSCEVEIRDDSLRLAPSK